MFPLLAHAGETLLGYEKNTLSQKNKPCLAQMGAAIYIPVPEPDCGDATKGSDQVEIKLGTKKKQRFNNNKKALSAFLHYQCLSVRVQSFLSIHSCPSDDFPSTPGKNNNNNKKQHNIYNYSQQLGVAVLD